ncbi:MAG TPA: YihA family ribosome biogenesis GTP-binding protein [Clostridiales bacterium]|nr:YihA family ribosome biogenesis GTP-binding protein [Clostridiales bacterium]
MIIKNAEYVTSIVSKKLFEGNAPEIAIAGRSNVGKSSFINMLTNRKKLARSSSEPGRTRMLNYFSLNDGECFLVDLPGYGYAKVTDKERDSWKGLIEYYLQESKNLRFVFLIVDIRHDPSELDLQLASYLDYYSIPYLLVATKADKLSKEGRKKALSVVAKGFQKEPEQLLVVSSLTGIGREEVLDAISSRL